MLGTIVEDRYLVEAELGEGAMGRVYRARHVKVGRQVAIKVMHEELAKIPTIVERFAREARIAARLDHRNLVSVLDVGVTAERLPLLVLELAPGCPLTDLMLDPMPRERAMSLIRQLLCGLDHAHDAGLVHRDLKPDNILVEQCADGTLVPRIVDFGIAVCQRDDDAIAGRRLTDVNTVIGTPLYMSPEQAMAKAVDARSDLFSLGIIMFELLAAKLPFDGEGIDVAYMNAMTDAPTIAERSGVLVDPLLEAFVKKLLKRRTRDRFQTAHEALLVLDLIDSDRVAAARALSDVVPAAIESVPAPVLAAGSGPVAVPEIVAAPVVVAEPRRSTKLTSLEGLEMPPTRSRALASIVLVAAVLTAIASWSFGNSSTPTRPRVATSLSVTAESAPPITEPTLVPPPIAVADVVTDAPVVTVPAKTPAKAVKPKAKAPARPATPGEVQCTPADEAAPANDTPITTATVEPATSNALANRYVAVGRALRGAPDALWARYRLIRINEALGNETSRKQALVALAEIERAIRK